MGANPGSIFDIDDPTDVEYGTHQQATSGRLSATDEVATDDSDYELLANWDSRKLQTQQIQTGNWKNYLTGSYQRAYAPGSVMKYREEESKTALQNMNYESSFYGSAAPTPAPVQQRQEPMPSYLVVRALYDYSAADGTSVLSNEPAHLECFQETTSRKLKCKNTNSYIFLTCKRYYLIN